MSYLSVGYSRVSVPLTTQRASMNLSTQQSSLTKIEEQLLTKVRYIYGSGDPSAAATAQSVMMLMERKTQFSINLQSTQSYLTSTDSSLANVEYLVQESRAMALESLNSATGASQRQALAKNISESINTIFNLANTKFLDRFLFGGSTTSLKPFEWNNESYSVIYRGSTSNVNSWSNTDLLSQSNMTGAMAFGAISSPIRGSDMNPAISNSTLLSSLNAGKGVVSGSVQLNFTDTGGKTTTSIVDLSRCVSIEDVRTALTKNTPIGASIHVDTTDNGLAISLNGTSRGSLTITEVSTGKTAKSLGIFTTTPIRASETFKGTDLNPILSKTTKIADLMGSRASTKLYFAGVNNDIVIRANSNGDTITDTDGTTWQMNGITVAVTSDVKIVAGQEQVSFDSATNTITVLTHPDDTTAANIIKAINTAAEDGDIPPVTAALDSLDTAPSGGGFVPLLPGTTVTSIPTQYGTGTNLDTTSGIQIRNGNKTFTLTFEDCKTVDDILNKLNLPEYGLLAEINPNRNGLNVSTRVSGTDFMIGENGGNTATQLGIRTMTEGTFLTELDFGRGVGDYQGPGTNASVGYMTTYENTGMLLTAKEEGTQWNGYEVHFYETTDPDGNVTVDWDKDKKIIHIGIVPGATRACEVVAAFAQLPGPKEAFTLELDDTVDINTGQGVVYEGSVTTTGGTDGGVDFTIFRNDGVKMDIDIHSAKTIGDVLDLINNHPDNRDGMLVAKLADFGNGIELVDNSVGGGQTTVTRSMLSTAAIDLGLIPPGAESQSQTTSGTKSQAVVLSTSLNSSLIFGTRFAGTYGNDITVEFVDKDTTGGSGQTSFQWDPIQKVLRFEIEPGVTTANDIQKLFERDATTAVKEMFVIQNGTNPDGSSSNGSGVVDLFSGDDTINPVITMTGGTAGILTGRDTNPLETKSLFNAMIRLQYAMDRNDEREIQRATNLLDDAQSLVTQSRSEVGIRQSGLDTVLYQLQDESLELSVTLDTARGISISDLSIQYSAQQILYQAAMTVTGNLFNLNLFNYI